MSAEAIAKVVADLKARKVLVMDRSPEGKKLALLAAKLVDDPVVVDASLIYVTEADKNEMVRMYEDHPCITPPWSEALVAYRNEHGNVVAMHISTEPHDSDKQQWEQYNPDDPVEWGRVKWISHVFLYVGGEGTAPGDDGPKAFPTSGPMHLWRFAIYDDGSPADLNWVQLGVDYPMQNWDMAQITLLGALNFLNCRNIELVEPRRPRAEARRIQRTGVRVSEINVFSMGKQYGANDSGPRSGGTPLTSVRGHFVNYGPEYGKGKLFGKYSGRFWVPQHARGSKEHGEVEQKYKLIPDERETSATS